MSLLFHLQLAGNHTLDSLALVLILWLPVIPLFLLDRLGEGWVRRFLRHVRSSEERAPTKM